MLKEVEIVNFKALLEILRLAKPGSGIDSRKWSLEDSGCFQSNPLVKCLFSSAQGDFFSSLEVLQPNKNLDFILDFDK